MSHRVVLSWVGGEHEFGLSLGGLRAVQTACDAGPQEVLQRLGAGTWWVDDPVEVLRHGLTGAGMEREAASRLVLRMADLHGLMRLVVTAQLVLSAALVGVADDPVGDEPGEATGQNRAPENGGSAVTMPPAPSAA